MGKKIIFIILIFLYKNIEINIVFVKEIVIYKNVLALPLFIFRSK